MRACFLAFALVMSVPAHATDHTDDIGGDTGEELGDDTDGLADTDGETASERAGDPGGLACNAVTIGGLATPSLVVGLLLVARRRETAAG